MHMLDDRFSTNVLKKSCKGKTRILVINQLHFLSHVDRIILVSEGEREEICAYQARTKGKQVSVSWNLLMSNPTGRVINRFSRDIDDIDCQVSNLMKTFLSEVWQLLSTFALIGIVSTTSLWTILPLLILFYATYLYYQLCRMEEQKTRQHLHQQWVYFSVILYKSPVF
ncbi:hypothetical protein SLE2022_234360 [Rubroshorea leprosula]